MKILLVDDERALVDALSALLKKNKYSVDVAYNGEDGLDCALSDVYDLIVLDVMMPGIDGISLLKSIRKNKIDTPVLMLSAKSETSDKIEGLNAGADDYLTKPFSVDELVARIKALLRRKEIFTSDILCFGDVSLNRDTFELSVNGKSIALNKKEFNILEMLILANGKAIDKETFIQKVWGYDSDAEYNTIEVYVTFIRRKLALLQSTTEIKSIRGIGYNLVNKND
ncbi:MAG: response regulator transcription factor [Clostridia bacterium]|nr:response regulator transcription factor [Clostridia bacterium]